MTTRKTVHLTGASLDGRRLERPANLLRELPAKMLVDELLRREALQVLTVETYLSGRVMTRHAAALYDAGAEEQNPAKMIATASAIRELTHRMLEARVLSVTEHPATEKYPDAPPDDIIIRIQLPVPNPEYVETPPTPEEES
jgi:hypothetical protein